MLLLTRGIGQKVIIHDPDTMAVLGEVYYMGGVGGGSNQGRLGFMFPQDVAINRQEIYEAILKEKTTDEFRKEIRIENDVPPLYFDGVAIRQQPANNAKVVYKEVRLNNRGCSNE